jgi:two-component system OmpR family sensor kinase
MNPAVQSRLPLFLSMLGYALACLIAVVLVNFAVILALPRPAPEVYQLRDVEAVLQGRATADSEKAYSVRHQSAPPSAPQPGSFRSKVEQRLAKDLGVKPSDVVFTRPPGNPLMNLTPNYNTQADARLRALRQQTFRMLDLTASSDQVVLMGPFIIGRRLSDGQWRVVETRSRQLLDPWTRGVLVWLLVSAVAMAPLAYLFARRLSSPISAFAAAAERLGRDPNAPPLALEGSAEIGVAARAFNEMQQRLHRYVQDRTSMIGAVAHDLRTPLTRLRFHIESAPPALREKMAADIADMDAMVAATLDFVREAGQTRERAKLELSSLLDRVIEDFAELGRDVRLQTAEPAVIEGDSLGLKRMFANLIDNAVKFGDAAEVSLRAEGGSVVVDIEDKGPGIRVSELEGVFEPFHRAEPSRSRDTGGIGLGLPVARSVARAHGGDVTLENLPEGGLRARVSLPV